MQTGSMQGCFRPFCKLLLHCPADGSKPTTCSPRQLALPNFCPVKHTRVLILVGLLTQVSGVGGAARVWGGSAGDPDQPVRADGA
jgi:hypothetical protein